MRLRKKKWLLLIPLVAIVILVLPLLKGGGGGGSAVETSTATLGSLEERSDGSGTLEGITRVEISAEKAGIIDTVAVEEGDTVSAGQLLLRLETDNARASLQQADANVTAAAIAVDQATREASRTETLWEAGLSSEEALAQAREAVTSARASLSQASASRTIAADDLEKTSYCTPIDGIVTEVNVEEGERAVVGTMNTAGTVLIAVEDMSTFLVRVTMVESEIVDVEEGMIAEVELDAFPDTVFAGTVENVGLAASNDAGGEEAAEYEVLIRLDQPVPRMRSGMSASVEVVTASRESCVTVPIQCIVRRTDPADPSREVSCVLAVEDGRVRVVPVQTGITGVMYVEVTGIDEGTRVVSGPTEMLRMLRDGDGLDGSETGSDDASGFPGPGPGAGPGGGPRMPPGGGGR